MPSHAPEADPLFSRVASWLDAAKRAVAFTGAGISTGSGISDFRSPGGVWSRYQPVLFDDFMASSGARWEYWRQKCEAHAEFAHASPNQGHRVLAAWEDRSLLHGVITQNIDGLHQDAGSRSVLELHGTARRIACLDCGWDNEPGPLVRRFQETEEVPDCPECGGMLKHATVSFGQALPADVLLEAGRWVEACNLLLAIGSSLVVEPAASLPRRAKAAGARLVIINRDPTPQDKLADAAIHTDIGRALAEIDAVLESSGA